jgi:hypothetical protein
VVTFSHQAMRKQLAASNLILGCLVGHDYFETSSTKIGGKAVNSKKIVLVALLCAAVAVVACRREEYRPLKLGGPFAEQPGR